MTDTEDAGVASFLRSSQSFHVAGREVEMESLRQELDRYRKLAGDLAVALRPFAGIGTVMGVAKHKDGQAAVNLYDANGLIVKALTFAHPLNEEGYLVGITGGASPKTGTFVTPNLRVRHMLEASRVYKDAMKNPHIGNAVKAAKF